VVTQGKLRVQRIKIASSHPNAHSLLQLQSEGTLYTTTPVRRHTLYYNSSQKAHSILPLQSEGTLYTTTPVRRHTLYYNSSQKAHSILQLQSEGTLYTTTPVRRHMQVSVLKPSGRCVRFPHVPTQQRGRAPDYFFVTIV